jgi:cytochrome d ubiquinol oxidase subunit I
MEGHWDGNEPGALVLFAWPDEKAETNRLEIAIPKLGSLIVTHNPDGLFPGLKSVPPSDRPPVVPVFFAFRALVGIGLLMLAAGWIGAFLWWRRRLFDTRWYLVALAWSWWLGFVAVISGWIVTESGRQPWLAHGILRTVDATSPVPSASIATTLVLFVLVYGVVFSAGIYYMNRLIAKGPSATEDSEQPASGLSAFAAAKD